MIIFFYSRMYSIAISLDNSDYSDTTNDDEDKAELPDILIVGGVNNPHDFKVTQDAYLINQNTTEKLASYPLPIYGSVGVPFSDLPTICGGKSGRGEVATRQCFQYEILNDTWRLLSNLQEPRFQSAGTSEFQGEFHDLTLFIHTCVQKY